MGIRLRFASLITISTLFAFVLSILFAASYVAGGISWQWLIGLTVVANVLIWLVSPYVSDYLYRWLYGATFQDIKQIESTNPKLAGFILQICEQEKLKPPKIGTIPDDNPTAFTYGSASFNARIILTRGLFKYLNEEEVEAVVAHELGHIAHKDFIVMAAASTLLQIFYEIYVIFRRAGSRRRKGSGLVLIAYASFLFYWLGSYLLLYLSRVREYYADEFSAKKTGDPNLLSSALLKVAYGIMAVPDTEKTHRLLGSTRALGIFDFKAAADVGLVYANQQGRAELLEKMLLFDIVSPWAFVLELSSTHPLVGKRIRRLCQMSENPAFNFERLMHTQVDKARLYKGFFAGLLYHYLPILLVVAGGIAGVSYAASTAADFAQTLAFSPENTFRAMIAPIFIFAMLGGGAGIIVKTAYKYPGGQGEKATVFSLLSDIYASPIRGRKVLLEGKVIGRGVAGYVLSEDMMFQDDTGLIYLNYESAIPALGNLIFAWKSAETLVGKPAQAEGWFVRGATHHLELKNLTAESRKINSYVKILPLAFGAILTFAALVWVRVTVA